MIIDNNILNGIEYGAGDLVVTSSVDTFILVEDSCKSYALNVRNGYLELEVRGGFNDLAEAITVNYGTIINHIPNDQLIIANNGR